MWKWIKKLLDIFAPKVKEKIPVVVPAKPQTQVLWTGWEALDFLKHGYESENQYREDSIAAAIQNGFDCMVIRLFANMIGALKIECLHWESDKDRMKFVNSWTDKATRAGIKKWLVIVPDTLTDLVYIEDCFKAYKPQTVQYVFKGGITEKIMDALGVDSNGVKITEPRFRK